jgi:hypothetical protein
MPQQMRAFGGCADSGMPYCASDGLPYRLTRNWDERGGRRDEDTIANLAGPTMPQIVQDRLSDSLWEWQSCLTSTFARYDQSSFLP